MAPLLADRFEVIAFDWPGMGYSDEWPGGATPHLLAKRLLTILDELKLQRPTSVYERIRCPTLVLWAEREQHFPVVQAMRLHCTIPGSTLAIVPGGTHWMPLSQAPLVAESIATFVAFK